MLSFFAKEQSSSAPRQRLPADLPCDPQPIVGSPSNSVRGGRSSGGVRGDLGSGDGACGEVGSSGGGRYGEEECVAGTTDGLNSFPGTVRVTVVGLDIGP